VRTLLEGSVRRAGNRVRINAQLVNATDGYQLWSDRFEHELTDIFDVQDRIATAIATTLRRALHEPAVAAERPAAEVAEPAKRFTRFFAPPVSPIPRPHRRVNAEAYDEVLKGRYLNNRHGGDADIQSAIGHFRRALELDPAFGAALAGLAESYLWLCILFVLPPTEAFAQVRRYARAAALADATAAAPYYLLGEIAFWHDWDATECGRYVRTGLALDPNSPETLMLSARLHLVLGRRTEMLEAMDAAVRADPVGYGTRWYYMVMLYLAGAFDRALAEADRLLAEAPDYLDARRWRGKARLLMGDVAGALEDLEAVAATAAPHAWTLAELSVALSANGRRDDATRIRDDLVQRTEGRWIPPTAIALAAVASGDFDAALRWCDRAFQTRDFLCVMLPFDGMFRVPLPGETKSIAEDPRWRDLVQRVGMTG
jgi:serine/threonine-protein kinase